MRRGEGRPSEAGLGMMGRERAPAFSAKASVQEPSPSFPRTIFVEHPRGGLDYGFIPKDIATKWNGKGAPIRLLNGDENDGALHIEKNHGEQIRGIGFQNIQQFIAHVVEHADAVFQGKGKAIILAVRSDKPWSAATLKMEYDPHGDFYAVKTALPIRDSFFRMKSGNWSKTLLWEGAPALRRREATPGAISGQSRLSIQNITPTDSPGKPGDDGSRHSIAGQSGDYQRDRIAFDGPDREPLGTRVREAGRETYRRFVHKDQPIVDLARRGDSVVAENIENQIRRMRGVGGVAEEMLTGKGALRYGLERQAPVDGGWGISSSVGR